MNEDFIKRPFIYKPVNSTEEKKRNQVRLNEQLIINQGQIQEVSEGVRFGLNNILFSIFSHIHSIILYGTGFDKKLRAYVNYLLGSV